LILASLACYFVIRHYVKIEQYDKIQIACSLIYGGTVLVAITVQSIVIARSKKQAIVKSHLDRYIATVWITAGLLMGLMVFLSLTINQYPTPFILGVTAMATALSGLMVRFRPLVLGSVIFLIASIISIYLNGADQLLVFAIAMVLGYLVPGYILRSSKSKDNV
jgi:ABC-type Fe3+-siderophore transport system permease subunit